jgi:hypothetical protein
MPSPCRSRSNICVVDNGYEKILMAERMERRRHRGSTDGLIMLTEDII